MVEDEEGPIGVGQGLGRLDGCRKVSEKASQVSGLVDGALARVREARRVERENAGGPMRARKAYRRFGEGE